MEGREGGSFARKLIISLLLARRYIVLASLTCDLDEMVSNRNDSSNELYIYLELYDLEKSSCERIERECVAEEEN